MVWFNVDDGFAHHVKAIRAGNAACGLWVRAGSWCARHLTDGYIPEDMVRDLGTVKQADRLVRAGLWTKVDGGYHFHDWGDDGRNLSRESVLARRQKDAERKQEQRARNRAKSEDVKVGGQCPSGTPHGTPGGTPPRTPDTPSLPFPSTTTSPNGEVGETSSPDTVNQRAQALTKHYTDRVPLSKFVAVLGITKKAISSGRYSDDQIREALIRLANDGRAVTVDSLRYELDGFPTPSRSPTGPRASTTDARVAAVQALKSDPGLRLIEGGTP